MPLIRCSKGCGDDVSVSDDVMAAALKSGSLDFSHAICPRDQIKTHPYRLDLNVYRDDVPGTEPVRLLATSATVHAPTLLRGWEALTTELAANVARLAGMVRFAEEGLDDENTVNTDNERTT